MNRNRFTTPPPPYNIDNKIIPINFQPPIPRFAVWPQPLPPLPPNQNIQPQYILPPPKKNYCSTCDLWTVEPYNNHQASPAHMAKKASLRTNQIYQPLYPNIINNVSNNVVNNVPNPNIPTIKKKCKRLTKRALNNNKLSGDLSEQNETNLIDEFSAISNDHFESKLHSPNTDSLRRKGQEMLIPVSGVFCALCEMFFPDKEIAENEHCSSEEHCDAYEKLLLKVQDAKVEKRPLNNVSTEENDSVTVEAKRPKIAQEHQDRDFRLIQSRSMSSPDVPVSIVLTPQAEGLAMLPNYTVNNIGGIVIAPVCSLPSLVPVLREPAPPIPREPAPPIPPEPASPVPEESSPPLLVIATTVTTKNNSVSLVPPIVTSTNITTCATTLVASDPTACVTAVTVSTPVTTSISSISSSTTSNSVANDSGTVTNVSVNEVDHSTGTDCQVPDFSLEFPEDMEDYDEGEIISEPES